MAHVALRVRASLARRVPLRHVRSASFDPWDAVAVAGALGMAAYAVPRLSRMLRGRFSGGSVYAESRREDQIVLLLESEQAAQDSLGAALPVLSAKMRTRLDALGALTLEHGDDAAGGSGDAASALTAVLKATASFSRERAASRGAAGRATDVVLARELFALLAPLPADGDAAAQTARGVPAAGDGGKSAAGAALDGGALAARSSGVLTAPSVFRLVALLVTSGVVPRENWPPHFSEPANVAHVLGSEVWHAVRGRAPGAIAEEEYDAGAHQALCCALLRVCVPQEGEGTK